MYQNFLGLNSLLLNGAYSFSAEFNKKKDRYSLYSPLSFSFIQSFTLLNLFL